MARYKTIDTSPKFLPVDLSRQLLPGTFEHALNHLLDQKQVQGPRFKGGFNFQPSARALASQFLPSNCVTGSEPISRSLRQRALALQSCGFMRGRWNVWMPQCLQK